MWINLVVSVTLPRIQSGRLQFLELAWDKTVCISLKSQVYVQYLDYS